MKAILALVAVLLCGSTACGRRGADETGTISPRIAGSFAGSASVAKTGANSLTMSATVIVTLPDADHAQFAGLCSDGTSIPVVGDGTRLVAVDTVTCSAAMFPECKNETMVITEFSAELFSGDSLNLAASGTIGGCDVPLAPFRFTFDGTRVQQ